MHPSPPALHSYKGYNLRCIHATDQPPPCADKCAFPHTLRIEELEGAIASALRVNKLLNAEVETYLSTADRCGGGQERGGRAGRGDTF